VNVEKIDQILSDALHALGAAQAELRKNASARDLGDVLRKVDDKPRANREQLQEATAAVAAARRQQDDAGARVLQRLDELNARLDEINRGKAVL
jgi:hypothetical protein